MHCPCAVPILPSNIFVGKPLAKRTSASSIYIFIVNPETKYSVFQRQAAVVLCINNCPSGSAPGCSCQAGWVGGWEGRCLSGWRPASARASRATISITTIPLLLTSAQNFRFYGSLLLKGDLFVWHCVVRLPWFFKVYWWTALKCIQPLWVSGCIWICL